MTIEELKKVPFRETCHMAMEGEYTTTYMSKDGRLGFCDHVPRDEFGMVKKGGRAVRHFMIDGKVYKSKKKFLEAIKDYNPDVVPINLRPYQNTVARMKHEHEAKPSATVVDMTPDKK